MNTLTKNNNESIKELKGKLKTLSNSLIEQRNKNKDYITRINELETEIYKSNLQNDTIHNENYEIQNQINISKNPNENEEDSIMKNVANLFNTYKDKIFIGKAKAILSIVLIEYWFKNPTFQYSFCI